MDLQSLLGYSYNSPFINNPYLDIQTPEGLIDMSNTPMDLMGIDNLGNVKKMKAGRKSPYRFKGNTVREIPLQKGGKTNGTVALYRPKDTKIVQLDPVEEIKAGRLHPLKKEPTIQEIKKAENDTERFFLNYLSSPKYVERLYKQGYSIEEIPTVISDRKNRLLNRKVSYRKGETNVQSGENSINFDTDEMKTYGLLPYTTVSHELSHIVGSGTSQKKHGSLNTDEYFDIYDRNKLSGQRDYHDSFPWEMKADIDALRSLLYRDKIYDTGKQDFNPEHLRKVREKYSDDFNVRRLLRYLSEDDLMYLMNNIAATNKKGYSGVSTYGQYGGKKQMGGNPYKGLSPKQMFDFLFDDEDIPKEAPKAPTVDEVDIQVGMNDIDVLRRMEDERNNELAMSMMKSSTGNPYSAPQEEIPYMGPLLSSGKFGNKNVGDYGRKIYGQLSRDLGYTPVVNSIYRSKEQQDALIAAGAPAVKNSWHLSGNAIDLKPQDWHKLSNEQQQYYTNNYDVIVHNGHYHIEPR